MQSKITPRGGNVEAVAEAYHRDQNFDDRRQIARLAKPPPNALKFTVTQALHGFAVNSVIVLSASTWSLADPRSLGGVTNADEYIGLVVQVIDANRFVVVTQGFTKVTGLSDWTTYYVGPSGTLVTYPNIATLDSPTWGYAFERALVTVGKNGWAWVHPTREHNHMQTQAITQSGHGFVNGDWIGSTNGTTWRKATSTNDDHFVGVVVGHDTNSFVMAVSGVLFLGANPGTATMYYLQDTPPGTIASTPPMVGRIRAVLYNMGEWGLILGPSVREDHDHDVDELADVTITSIADKQTLTWDAATSSWINGSLSFGMLAASWTVTNDLTGATSGLTETVTTTGLTITLGKVPIAQGGTNAITAAAGFDNLAPTTTRGDLIVHNATTNARLALGAAKKFMRSDGTDASWSFILAGDFPTIGSATGNARGTGAVDWQNSASGVNVASGTDATIGGGSGNKANFDYATVAGGQNNAASGLNATISGGNGNTTNASYATVVGGNASTASGTAAIAGGDTCTASGIDSIALGDHATASGSDSLALSCFSASSIGATAAGDNSFAIGVNVKTRATTGNSSGIIGAASTMTQDNGTYTLTLVAANGIYLTGNLFIGANQVVGPRGSAVTAPTGGSTVDSQARTAINDLISRLQAHGLIS